jgi:sugar O-acyltransferase (sialic acid O-acetyltransferase NeuD family)
MEIFELQKRKILGFCDDDLELKGSTLYGYQILGDISYVLPNLKGEKIDFFIGIGNNNDRKKIADKISNYNNMTSINAIHPSAILSHRIELGLGNFLGPGISIKIATIIGNYTIINTGATIGHDVVIHDFAQISPGCNLTGNVTVEEGVFIGAGAIVIPGKRIGAHAVIGAGAVVIHDIPPYCTAVGNPARIIKRHSKEV